MWLNLKPLQAMPNLQPLMLYDLSGFDSVKITLQKSKEELVGKLVKFRIKEGTLIIAYPDNEYCFVPHISISEYENFISSNKPILPNFPPGVLLLSELDILEITIYPGQL